VRAPAGNGCQLFYQLFPLVWKCVVGNCSSSCSKSSTIDISTGIETDECICDPGGSGSGPPCQTFLRHAAGDEKLVDVRCTDHSCSATGGNCGINVYGAWNFCWCYPN